MMFSKNLEEENKKEICLELEEVKAVTQEKYLGLPMVIIKSKNQVFNFFREKMKQRLKAGKENC